jgi:hypothetical protein
VLAPGTAEGKSLPEATGAALPAGTPERERA